MNEKLKKLRELAESGELDRQYAEARRASDKLRAELEASKRIDPATLQLTITC